MTESERWLLWLQQRIPEAKLKHNAFWIKVALEGYAQNICSISMKGPCEIWSSSNSKCLECSKSK